MSRMGKWRAIGALLSGEVEIWNRLWLGGCSLSGIWSWDRERDRSRP